MYKKRITDCWINHELKKNKIARETNEPSKAGVFTASKIGKLFDLSKARTTINKTDVAKYKNLIAGRLIKFPKVIENKTIESTIKVILSVKEENWYIGK